MKPPILITGCARSGTSLVAGIINMCGAFGGDMSGPNKNNAKGMFENARIRNNIVKPYFMRMGVDRLGQYPLPDTNNMVIPPEWRKKVEQVMIDEGYTDSPWMYKGAKLCLHWPVWDYAFPEAKWVIVRRKTPDIVNSCMRTGFMRAFSRQAHQRAVGAKSEAEGWLWWVHQHEERFKEMMIQGMQVQEVWPERMVEGDYSQIKEMLEWLGLEWTDKVMEFIEPKLWKARKIKV
jgi:hypothetical protein